MMQKKNRISDIFPIMLFLVFTLSALGVVLFSVRVYQNILNETDGKFNTQTTVSYLSEKVRSHDLSGGIRAGDFLGNDAVIFEESVKGVPYVTYIYAYGGYLREIFTEKDMTGDLIEDSGTRILEISGFDVEEVSDRLIKVSITDNEGNHTDAYLSRQSSDDGVDYEPIKEETGTGASAAGGPVPNTVGGVLAEGGGL